MLVHLGFLNIYHYTIVGNPNKVKIGKNVGLNNAILNVASGRIIIGNNITVGNGALLITGIHDYRKKGIERKKAWPRSGRDIVIEDGVFIGSGAIILGKVRIGRNAVVGAGSVVTKDVKPDTLVAGVPAKFIRKIEY